MDLIIYIIVLMIIGIAKMILTRDVSDFDIRSSESYTVQLELPVGENLGLIKEEGAFTLILRELNLIC